MISKEEAIVEEVVIMEEQSIELSITVSYLFTDLQIFFKAVYYTYLIYN